MPAITLPHWARILSPRQAWEDPQMTLFYEEDLAFHRALVEAHHLTRVLNSGEVQTMATTTLAPKAPVGRDLQLAPNALATSKKQYDEIVLDGSGSMQIAWWDMLSHIDSYVEQVKSNQLDSHIRLSIFTTGDSVDAMDLVARNTHISGWVPLLTDPVGSYFGSTPLYDAIALAVQRLAKLDPERAALTIVTDGAENGSKFTTLDQAKGLLDWCKAKGWQVS